MLKDGDKIIRVRNPGSRLSFPLRSRGEDGEVKWTFLSPGGTLAVLTSCDEDFFPSGPAETFRVQGQQSSLGRLVGNGRLIEVDENGDEVVPVEPVITTTPVGPLDPPEPPKPAPRPAPPPLPPLPESRYWRVLRGAGAMTLIVREPRGPGGLGVAPLIAGQVLDVATEHCANDLRALLAQGAIEPVGDEAPVPELVRVTVHVPEQAYGAPRSISLPSWDGSRVEDRMVSDGETVEVPAADLASKRLAVLRWRGNLEVVGAEPPPEALAVAVYDGAPRLLRDTVTGAERLDRRYLPPRLVPVGEDGTATVGAGRYFATVERNGIRIRIMGDPGAGIPDFEVRRALVLDGKIVAHEPLREEPPPAPEVAEEEVGSTDEAEVDGGDSLTPAVRKAVQWLRQQLRRGPARAEDLYRAGKPIGFGRRTLERAKKAAGIVSERHGFGNGSHVEWSAPRLVHGSVHDPEAGKGTWGSVHDPSIGTPTGSVHGGE